MNTSGGALRRREEIRRLVRREAVRSQEELQELLLSRGFEVAQPTLSRDLRELGLAKTHAGYVDPAAGGAAFVAPEGREERLARVLGAFGLGVQVAASLVVVKTPPAGAQAVGLALDAAELSDVVGTISGDDTVFVATPSASAARRLAARLAAALPGRPARRPRR